MLTLIEYQWPMLRTWCFLLSLPLAILLLINSGDPEIVPQRDLIGSVTKVRDGDTIVVENVPVRLQGLTCDEKGTELGDQATRAVKTLVQGSAVSCDLSGKKSWDREVGRCQIVGGPDIGAALIAQRLCGRCERYDPQGRYTKIQQEAGSFLGSVPKYCTS